MQPPRVLETARLRLREPAPRDVRAIFEYASDVEVTRLMDWERLTDASQVLDLLARSDSYRFALSRDESR